MYDDDPVVDVDLSGPRTWTAAVGRDGVKIGVRRHVVQERAALGDGELDVARGDVLLSGGAWSCGGGGVLAAPAGGAPGVLDDERGGLLPRGGARSCGDGFLAIQYGGVLGASVVAGKRGDVLSGGGVRRDRKSVV